MKSKHNKQSVNHIKEHSRQLNCALLLAVFHFSSIFAENNREQFLNRTKIVLRRQQQRMAL